jgi:hypothetical protein
LKHEQWFFTPEQGAAVTSEELYLVPVDPVLYKMKDIWGYDHEELPCEPFDIEIKIQSENVLEGLKIFESAVKGYLSTSLKCSARTLYLEKLLWSDQMTEIASCEILMSG